MLVLDYPEVGFGFFCPTEVTCCTDGGEIWRVAMLLWVIDPKTVKFYDIWECKCSAGAQNLQNSYEMFSGLWAVPWVTTLLNLGRFARRSPE